MSNENEDLEIIGTYLGAAIMVVRPAHYCDDDAWEIAKGKIIGLLSGSSLSAKAALDPMSAQDELPPGCTADDSRGGRFPWRVRYHNGELSLESYMYRHEIVEWAQSCYDMEGLATMRAAVAELEALRAVVAVSVDQIWSAALESELSTGDVDWSALNEAHENLSALIPEAP